MLSHFANQRCAHTHVLAMRKGTHRKDDANALQQRKESMFNAHLPDMRKGTHRNDSANALQQRKESMFNAHVPAIRKGTHRNDSANAPKDRAPPMATAAKVRPMMMGPEETAKIKRELKFGAGNGELDFKKYDEGIGRSVMRWLWEIRSGT